jgi:hypothetical protein
VDGVIELAVSSAAETMDDSPSGRVLDGSHTGIGGELIPVGEPADISGVADEGGRQDGADAIDVRQRGPRGPHCVLDPLVGGLQLGIEALHIVKELVGQLVSGPFHRGDRIEGIEEAHGVRSVEFLGDSPW